MLYCASQLVVVFMGLAHGHDESETGLCQRSDYTVAIDAGHGPVNSGATSARGRSENEFNVRLASETLRALHQAGFSSAFLVNPDNTDLTRTARANRAAQGHADVFISLHHDSVQEHYLQAWTHNQQPHRYCDDFSGHSLFVNLASVHAAESRAFGARLGKRLLDAGLTPTLHHAEDIPGEARELLDPEIGLYRYDALTVLKRAQSPALLLEAGVLVNRDDEARLDQSSHRLLIVNALVGAVEETCAGSMSDR